MAVSSAQETVRFGLFELDMRAAQLTRNGTTIRLPQQPLRLLSILLESPGAIVTREQLRQRLWPSDIFIDFDHGLNKSMQKLRDALGDSAVSPRYIETVPRVGYRFIAPVRDGRQPVDPEGGTSVSEDSPGLPASSPPAATGDHRTRRLLFAAAGALVVVATAGIAVYLFTRRAPEVVTYTQLTDFTDSASGPALSPDGRIVAFFRGDSSFFSTGRVYVKMLPSGEASLLTDDPRPKYGLAFSPDGSQIAYTVFEDSSFNTYVVPVLGGDPHLLLKNASGLSWPDANDLLFSRVLSGMHMGVVTETANGEHHRELYFPPHERGMAHRAFASPDRRSALTVEMNGQGEWGPCQLISLTRPSPPAPVRQAGPAGQCTGAGWSPDGSSMYFVATVDGKSHLWRQRYRSGRPEQITASPSEEEGLAVEQDGRSLITSIGGHESAIWIHDPAGERSISSEGEIVATTSPPSFATDGRSLYYLLRHQGENNPELWRLQLDSGKAEAVFPGTSMIDYDVSPDGKQVVYTVADRDGGSQLWLAPVDRSSAARQIGQSGETTPHFGARGQILFRRAEGNVNYLEQMNQDGSGRSKVLPYPIAEVQGVSPGRRWVMAVVLYPERTSVPMVAAIPLDGGPPRRICASFCVPVWASNGRTLYVPVEVPSVSSPGRSLAIPVGAGESLPEFPPGGIQPLAEPNVIPGAQSIRRAELIPGKDLSHYAYEKTTVHRNLYRVSLP